MPRRYRRHTETVEVPWSHEDAEYLVTVSVGPEQPEIRWGDNACPYDAGDVEILSVREDGGAERPDLLDAAEADRDTIEEAAMQAAADAALAAEEDAAEAREDARREAMYEARRERARGY